MDRFTKYRCMASLLVCCLFLGGLGVWGMCKPDQATSRWERRKLAQKPAFSITKPLTSQYASDMETYLTDQFPLRDQFRQIKAVSRFGLMMQKDVRGYYIADGSVSKLDPVLKESSLKNAAKRFNELYDAYLQESEGRVFFCVIPDKNIYLAEPNGYSAIREKDVREAMQRSLPQMQFVPVADLLDQSDYYKTDTHWRQEELLPVADALGTAMGIGPSPAYETRSPGTFRGVYYGHSALPLPAEPMYYLSNRMLDACTVYNAEKDVTKGVYDLDAWQGNDPYDLFLSGAVPVLEITNPEGPADRELIVFRDSFGSSLTPLLVHGYSRITLIDTRYIAPKLLENYVDFHGQDVLFAYSTLLLNSSTGLRGM